LTPRAALLATVALLGGALLTWWHFRSSQRVTVSPGTVVFEIQPTLLVKLEYRSSKQWVIATRPNDSDDAFSVVVNDASGKERERCSAGGAFGLVLDSLTKIVARESLVPDELEKRLLEPLLGESALLRLEDSTEIGPVEWRVAETPRGVLFYTQDAGYVVDTPSAIFARLEAGCRGVGSP